MAMRRALFAVVLAVLPACGGGDEAPAPAAAPVVQIVDFDFEPAKVEVPVGGTVEWVYAEDGSSVHTVTFEGGPDSGAVRPGETYRHTFDAPGTRSYVCIYHPEMTGTVDVTE